MAHLYKGGAKAKTLKRFEAKYGATRGRKVYGAVVGKVKRERQAKAGRTS